jgi:RNA polymerase sigma factor (sigma-70 family)
MTASNSLPGRLERIQDHDERAIEELWRRYYPQLARLAEQKLRHNGIRPGTCDGEDVAASALASFFKAVQHHRFEELRDEEGLLRLLRRMTTRKVIDRLRKQQAIKAGGGKVAGESVFDAADSSAAGIDAIAGEEPTGEWLVVMEEEIERLFAKLGSEELRLIAQLRLANYSNAEIAAQRDCSIATVERRLKMIRACWSREE